MPSYAEPLEIQIPMPWGHVAGCWYGDPHIRPLIALHGWQENAGSFARLAPLLAADVPILAIDLPGHGHSSHLPPGMKYHLLEFARVIYRIHRHFQWPKLSLLAHSMGAAAAYVYATVFANKVDMLCLLDAPTTRYFTLDVQMSSLTYTHEKFTREIELQQQTNVKPLWYNIADLEELIYQSLDYSLDKQNVKHIMQRNIEFSEEQPQKVRFRRDGRIKFMTEFYTEPGLNMAMAKRLRNVKYIAIKALNSTHFDAEKMPILEAIRANNPIFEYHELEGTHHVHLNDPHAVAGKLLPFLQQNFQIDRLENIVGNKL